MPRIVIQEAVLNSRNPGVSYPGTETTGDVANGHFFVWGQRKFLSVRNTSGSTAYNVTITPASHALDVFAGPPKVISVPLNVQRIFGPFSSVFQHPEDNGYVYVDVQNAALVLKVFDFGKG